jgi:hypothetical protein
MRECPTEGCRGVLADNAITCNSCGWEAPKRSANRNGGAPEHRHPVDGHRLCDHEDAGQLCAGPGTFSSSVHGAGPWFCFAHFPAFRNWNHRGTAPPNGFEALRALTHRVTPSLGAFDFEALAERKAIEGDE